jgi:hypothetical protein
MLDCSMRMRASGQQCFSPRNSLCLLSFVNLELVWGCSEWCYQKVSLGFWPFCYFQKLGSLGNGYVKKELFHLKLVTKNFCRILMNFSSRNLFIICGKSYLNVDYSDFSSFLLHFLVIQD